MFLCSVPSVQSCQIMTDDSQYFSGRTGYSQSKSTNKVTLATICRAVMNI